MSEQNKAIGEVIETPLGVTLASWYGTKPEVGTKLYSQPVAQQSQVPEAWTNLLAYVLQDDLHNRLTPRVIDIAYSAFMAAKQPNKEDGSASDWFNDTKPMVVDAIAKLRKDLIAERGELPVDEREAFIYGGDLLKIASKNSINADYCDLQKFAKELINATTLHTSAAPKPANEDLRNLIGQAISDAIAGGAPEPDFSDSREVDRLADAVMAVLPVFDDAPDFSELAEYLKENSQEQHHAGISAEKGGSLWHTDRKGLFWCGSWYHRTPKQLYDEAVSVINGLRLRAAIVADSGRTILPKPIDPLSELEKELDGWKEEAGRYKDNWERAREELNTIRLHQANDAWYWQGDGCDHLESMSNGMVVVIRADQLRGLLKKADTDTLQKLVNNAYAKGRDDANLASQLIAEQQAKTSYDFSRVIDLTHQKTKGIIERNGYAVCGFVLKDDQDKHCIVSDSAVRWFAGMGFFHMMHSPVSFEVQPVNVLTNTAPQEIYLQVSDELADKDMPFPRDPEFVTWCADSVLASQVKYVRADLIGSTLQEHTQTNIPALQIVQEGSLPLKIEQVIRLGNDSFKVVVKGGEA